MSSVHLCMELQSLSVVFFASVGEAYAGDATVPAI